MKSARHMNRIFHLAGEKAYYQIQKPLNEINARFGVLPVWHYLIGMCAHEMNVYLCILGNGRAEVRVTKNSFQLHDIDHISCIHFH